MTLTKRAKRGIAAYDEFMSDYAYDYYDWVCSEKSCQLCDILTNECCDPDRDVNCFLADSCQHNPCLSGGSCISTRTLDNRADFVCICLPGLTGKYCQLVNEDVVESLGGDFKRMFKKRGGYYKPTTTTRATTRTTTKTTAEFIFTTTTTAVATVTTPASTTTAETAMSKSTTPAHTPLQQQQQYFNHDASQESFILAPIAIESTTTAAAIMPAYQPQPQHQQQQQHQYYALPSISQASQQRVLPPQFPASIAPKELTNE